MRFASRPHDVIGLMGSGMVEIFTLDVNLCPAESLTEVLQVGYGRGASRVTGHERHVLFPEGWIRLGGGKGVG